ncbi:MAG: hypothetical protein WB609_10255 [Candidatus Cybelea sp.]
MPDAHEAPSALARWTSASPSPATSQYKGLVQRFLKAGRVADLRSVELSDLIAHVQSLSGTDIRRKAAGALSKFFAYLAKSGEIASNPALELVATLKEEKTREKTRRQLVAAGMNDEDAAHLTWRDVARVIFGTGSNGVPSDRMPPLASDVMTKLARKLLSRMSSCPIDALENLLGRSIDA